MHFKSSLLFVTFILLGAGCSTSAPLESTENSIQTPTTQTPSQPHSETPSDTVSTPQQSSGATFASFTIPKEYSVEFGFLNADGTGASTRIQNFTSQDSYAYEYPADAFFLEISDWKPGYGNTDEQEAAWRSAYDKVVERTLDGRKVLFGSGRHPGGDGWPGTGYFASNVGMMNLSARSDSGLKKADAIVQTLKWKK